MALTTTVTKKSVSQTMDGMFNITYNLLYKDDTTVLIDQDFSAVFKTGFAWATTVTEKMRTAMKAAIAKYKAEQAILNGTPIDASVTNLNSTVGV